MGLSAGGGRGHTGRGEELRPRGETVGQWWRTKHEEIFSKCSHVVLILSAALFAAWKLVDFGKQNRLGTSECPSLKFP